MNCCSICGWEMLLEGVEYHDGQLVACGQGHVATVFDPCCDEGELTVREADPASVWVRRLALAFDADDSRRDDVRVLADAVKRLESRLDELEPRP